MSRVYTWGDPKPDASDVAKLDALLKEVDTKLTEATEFARSKGLSFHFEGPAYGMGGSFDPERGEDEWGEDTGGWLASSQSC